jgi:nucleotide-binding universal stress UspA family protein
VSASRVPIETAGVVSRRGGPPREEAIESPLHDIVVATDFTSNAHIALERAAQLASLHGCSLHLVNGVRASRRRSTAYRHIEEEIAFARTLGSEATGVVIEGSAAHAIAKEVEARESDLVVMGASSRSLRSRIEGSAALRIAHTARVPVLVVNREVERRYRSVGVAVELEPSASHAVDVARRIAPHAFVDVVHAYIGIEGKLRYASVPDESITDDRWAAHEEARHTLERWFPRDRHTHVKLLHGDARVVVPREAQRERRDLIVLVHRGSRLRHALFGSVIPETLRAATMDVLVV